MRCAENPQSPQELAEEKRLAGILKTFVWVLFGVCMLVIVTSIIFSEWKLIAVTAAASALLIFPLALIRRACLQAASFVFMLCALFLITIIATAGQGIRDIAVVAFPIVFIFAGLTLDRKLFKICFGLALAAVSWLVIGEVFGVFSTVPFSGNLETWVLLSGEIVLLSIAALAVDVLATNMRKNLELARQEIIRRTQAEEKVGYLLAEKELLLKEVHHRIKNNMAGMISLLNLQARKQKDPAVIAVLEDAGQRMKSMGVLYSQLYQSPGFCELSLKNYLEKLIGDILKNQIEDKSIKVEMHIVDYILDAKRLQPLGIMVNELLTNIMKYAFTGKSEGIITVCATILDKVLLVSVADDGIGIPESQGFGKSSGFGLMLVQALAEQLSGKISIERGNGTKILLEFAV